MRLRFNGDDLWTVKTLDRYYRMVGPEGKLVGERRPQIMASQEMWRKQIIRLLELVMPESPLKIKI